MEIQIINSREDASGFIEEITKLLYENLMTNLPEDGWTIDDASKQAETLLSNLENKTANLFIATANGNLIGFAWTYRRQFGRRQRLHINHIIVQPGRRGSGIGKEILNAIIAKAKEMNMDAVDLLSSKDREEVVRFYLQNGFCVERLQMIYKLPKI